MRMRPRVVSTRLDRAARVALDAGHFAILDDVDAERIGGARVAPGDGIVPRRAAAPLQRRAQHRIADVVFDVQRRTERLRLRRLEPLVVDAVAAVGVHVALEDLDVVHGVRQHHDAARREHDVVIERLREVLPQLDRMIVERRAFVEQIVRADDGGVAAGVAAADPAFLEHRDVRQAVLLGQIVGGAQAMAAAADDDGIVARLGLGLAPLRLPAAMTRQAAPDQRTVAENDCLLMNGRLGVLSVLGSKFLVLGIIRRIDQHRRALALAQDLDLKARCPTAGELRLDVAQPQALRRGRGRSSRRWRGR